MFDYHQFISSGNKLMEGGAIRRTCAECSATRTPLWRGGPAGPRSLCNACGIRHRKNIKRTQVRTQERPNDKKNKHKRKSRNDEKCVMRFLGVYVQMRRKLRVEEEAAILLMAMSYGYGSILI